MKRRDLLQYILTTLALAPITSLAQSRERVPIVGLPLIFAAPGDPIVVALREGLRERGWIDGETIRLEHRYAEGKIERLPEILNDLLQLKPDIFIGGAVPIVQALKKSAPHTPIVIVAYDYDPVAMGFVESMNRPGGNLTGVYGQTVEIAGKLLELLRDLLPKLKKVALIHDEFAQAHLQVFGDAAKMLGLTLETIRVLPPYDYDALFKRFKKEKFEAVALSNSPRFHGHTPQIVSAMRKYRLPNISGVTTMVRAGGLISYGANAKDTFGRAAYFVDRILKGAKPGELPVEQPNIYRLSLNLSTAKALGIVVPESIMIRATDIFK